MYLPVNGKIEFVTISNEIPDSDYIFIEETTHYYRYRPVFDNTKNPDMFVFKIKNIDALKEYLSKRTDQYNLQARYEKEHPISWYEYIKRKLKMFKPTDYL